MAFSRSNKLKRTPPAVKFSCKKCSKADDTQMVRCNTCNVAFHYTCAGITSETNIRDWTCEECLIVDDPATQDINQPLDPDQSRHDESNASVCQICSHYDQESRVQCDKCDLWFHFKCVNVTDAIKDEDWMCASCMREGSIVRQTNQEVRSIKSNSRKSKSGTSTSSRRKSLALQRLDEEQRMRAQREKEYLERKYAILEDLSGESSEFSIDEGETIPKSQRTSEWLQGVAKENGSATHFEKNEDEVGVVKAKSMANANENGVSKELAPYESHSQQLSTVNQESQCLIGQINPILAPSTTEAVFESWSKLSGEKGYTESISQMSLHDKTNENLHYSLPIIQQLDPVSKKKMVMEINLLVPWVHYQLFHPCLRIQYQQVRCMEIDRSNHHV